MKTMSPGQFGILVAPALCAALFLGASTALTGTGEGTQHLARLLLAPASVSEKLEMLGVAYWAGFGLLLALRGHLVCRLLAGVALLAHYGGIVSLGNKENWSFIGRAWEAVPALLIVILSLYAISQVVFWIFILRGKRVSGRHFVRFSLFGRPASVKPTSQENHRQAFASSETFS